MNYLGAEPARYQLRTLNFLVNTKLTFGVSSFEGGLLSVSDPEGRGIKPLMIKPSCMWFISGVILHQKQNLWQDKAYLLQGQMTSG